MQELHHLVVEEKRECLTSLKTKTWFRTHIGSISFKTEHRLVSLCTAASNLPLPGKNKGTVSCVNIGLQKSAMQNIFCMKLR